MDPVGLCFWFGFDRISWYLMFLHAFMGFFSSRTVIWFADRGRRCFLVCIDYFPVAAYTSSWVLKKIAPPRWRRRSGIKLCSRRAIDGCRRNKTWAPPRLFIVGVFVKSSMLINGLGPFDTKKMVLLIDHHIHRENSSDTYMGGWKLN